MSKKKRKHHHDKHEKSQVEKELPLALTDELGEKGTLDKVLEHYKAWLPKYQELAQGRSNFQIEKMIATEHATPAASYQHTLYQLRVLHQSLIDDFVRGIEKTREFEYKWKDKPTDEPQFWETEKGGKKMCWYDTDRLRHEHEMEELKMSVKDKLLQLETFTKVLQAMEEQHGGHYTQAELNAEEPEYWKLRLARQMTDSYMERLTGLGTGNIKSLRMALADSPIKESHNRIDDFPDIFNAVLGDRETALNVMNEVNSLLFKNMNTLGHDTEEAKPKLANKRSEVVENSTRKKLSDVGIGISELED